MYNFNLDSVYAHHGCYGHINKYFHDNVTWISCRDEFFEYGKLKEFVFWAKKRCRNKVIQFMGRIQNKLKLANKDRLIFSKTNYKDILHIKVSRFWNYPLRRSLLTALLRAGQDYKRSYKKAIGDYYVLDETMPAVKKFLDGYTRFKKKSEHFSGWHNEFINICNKIVYDKEATSEHINLR